MKIYKLYRGSDRTIPFRLKDAAGAAIPLTGATVQIYDAHPALAGNILPEITDAAQGAGHIRITWNDAMPNGREMVFRVRFVIEGERIGGPQVWLEVE